MKEIAILLDFAARSNLPGGGNDARASAVRTDGADAAGIAHARASGRRAGRAHAADGGATARAECRRTLGIIATSTAGRQRTWPR